MYPKTFEYHAPRTVGEATGLLTKYGPDAKILAGGQSLIPLMKLRLLSPAHIIDLGKVEGLSYIRKEGHELAIGAMTRVANLISSELVNDAAPILSECAMVIADSKVRNMGTIGGNISHADPTNDMPAVMIASGATLDASAGESKRNVPASEFFLDSFTTALEPQEILTEVRVPINSRRVGAYRKLERQAGDFAIAGVAAVLDISDNGVCASCGIGLTGVGATVVRAVKAERILQGTRLEEDKVESAATAAAEESNPSSDLRGSAEYKRKMVKVLTVRAVKAAAARGTSN